MVISSLTFLPSCSSVPSDSQTLPVSDIPAASPITRLQNEKNKTLLKKDNQEIAGQTGTVSSAPGKRTQGLSAVPREK